MIKTTSLKLCSTISLALLCGGAMASITIAHEDEYYDFPTGEHEGGGVRGKGIGCVAHEAQNPQAFIPEDTQTLTVSDTPELLFYVPDVDQASTLEILLHNQNNELVSRREFSPGSQPGIVSLNLIDDTNNKILKFNNLYSWYLVQECAGVNIPKVVASGSLKRIELDQNIAQQLERASPSEKIRLYQSANIWHEAIANLARSKCDLTEKRITTKPDMKVENVDYSLELFSTSLDTYCTADLEEESMVMQ